MSKVLAVLKALSAPFVGVWAWWSKTAWPWLKSWFGNVEPKVASAAADAVASAPGWGAYLGARLKSLGNGFVVLGKALISLKFWTRVAVLAVMAAAFIGVWLNGHAVGHAPVNALTAELTALGKTIASDKMTIAGLTADLAKANSTIEAMKKPTATVAPASKPVSASPRRKATKTSETSLLPSWLSF